MDNERAVFEELAYQRVYEKPWYEAHALNFLNIVRTGIKDFPKPVPKFIDPSIINPAKFQAFYIASLTGQLGRLVEQYYWRFRFERAVVAGESARKGASAGGKIKAERYRTKHSAWQNEASKIWARRPDLTNNAVGKIIRKQFGEACTARHIARCITMKVTLDEKCQPFSVSGPEPMPVSVAVVCDELYVRSALGHPLQSAVRLIVRRCPRAYVFVHVGDPAHRLSRPLVIVAAGLGMLLAGTLALWAHYGSAVFCEMILAGIATCF